MEKICKTVNTCLKMAVFIYQNFKNFRLRVVLKLVKLNISLPSTAFFKQPNFKSKVIINNTHKIMAFG